MNKIVPCQIMASKVFNLAFEFCQQKAQKRQPKSLNRVGNLLKFHENEKTRVT